MVSLPSSMEVDPKTPKNVTIGQVEISQDESSASISLTASNIALPDLQPGAGPSKTSREFPLLLPEQERLFTKRHIHRWKSPLLMLSFFVIGLAMSIAHCIFYPALKTKIVGGSSSQEEKLRWA